MDPEKRKRLLEQGRVHLEFVVKLYKYQISQGRYFVHEHPWAATSWKEECMRSLREEPTVRTVRGDMCRHGMTLEGEKVYKPTGW